MYQEITNTSSLVNIWKFFFIHFGVRREMLGLFFSAYFFLFTVPFWHCVCQKCLDIWRESQCVEAKLFYQLFMVDTMGISPYVIFYILFLYKKKN